MNIFIVIMKQFRNSFNGRNNYISVSDVVYARNETSMFNTTMSCNHRQWLEVKYNTDIISKLLQDNCSRVIVITARFPRYGDAEVENKCFSKKHIPSYGPCWRPKLGHPWGYMQASVLGPVLADDVGYVHGGSLVHGRPNCTIAPQLTRGCRTSGDGQQWRRGLSCYLPRTGRHQQQITTSDRTPLVAGWSLEERRKVIFHAHGEKLQ